MPDQIIAELHAQALTPAFRQQLADNCRSWAAQLVE